jgi:hypothetical protein
MLEGESVVDFSHLDFLLTDGSLKAKAMITWSLSSRDIWTGQTMKTDSRVMRPSVMTSNAEINLHRRRCNLVSFETRKMAFES